MSDLANELVEIAVANLNALTEYRGDVEGDMEYALEQACKAKGVDLVSYAKSEVMDLLRQEILG